MTRLTITTKSLRAALLLSVLTPAPLLAEPALTARQMLAQAQTKAEVHQASGALTQISRRLSTIEAPAAAAAEPAKPTATAAVAEPQVAPAPAALVTSDAPAVTIRPEPAVFVTAAVEPTAPERVTPLETKAGTPQAISTPPAIEPAAPVSAPTYTSPTKPEVKAEVATPAPAPADVAKQIPAPATASVKEVPKPEQNAAPAAASTRKENAERTVHAKTSAPQERRRHSADFNTVNLDGQIQRIINRPEVRAALAQYGLN